MAYIPAYDDDEKDQPQQATAPAAGGAAPTGPVAAQPQQQQPAASKFVNFSRYLNANRDSAQNTANQMTAKADQEGAAVKQGVQQATATFQQSANATQPVQYVAPVGRHEQMSLDDGAAQSYGGPKALSDDAGWSDLQKRSAALQDRANIYGRSSGVGAGLQERAAGQYGSGARRLDQSLVGTVGADQFAGLRDRYGKLSAALTQANDASKATAAERTGEFETAAGTFKDEQGRRETAHEEYTARGAEIAAKGDPIPGLPPNVFDNMSVEEVQEVKAAIKLAMGSHSLFDPGPQAELERLIAWAIEKYGGKEAKPQFKYGYAQGSNPR